MKTSMHSARKNPDSSHPFGLSLSKPAMPRGMPFDKLRANGIAQSFPDYC
jgi:hypothetical protein